MQRINDAELLMERFTIWSDVLASQIILRMNVKLKSTMVLWTQRNNHFILSEWAILNISNQYHLSCQKDLNQINI